MVGNPGRKWYFGRDKRDRRMLQIDGRPFTSGRFRKITENSSPNYNIFVTVLHKSLPQFGTPSPMYRYTTCASRMMLLDRGKLVVHSQRGVCAMRDTAGTHYTVPDRRLAPDF
jgi:hypothetical protein